MTRTQSIEERRTLRVATRSSALALAQTRSVTDELRAQTGIDCEIVPIATKGDTFADRRIAAIGTDGVFVTELFAALLDGRADIAVHSMKDLPTALPVELCCAAVPKREDPRDALVTKSGISGIEALPRGAVVGTGSLRRSAQLRLLRPDLEIVPLRGNVDTRVRKVIAQECDAAVLAFAGLKRAALLEIAAVTPLASEVIVPAVGQGALCVQCRVDDEDVRRSVSIINHAPSALAVGLERALLARLGGGCLAPIGAHVQIVEQTWQLCAVVAAPDGSSAVRHTAHGSVADEAKAFAAVEEIGATILSGGGRDLIDRSRHESVES